MGPRSRWPLGLLAACTLAGPGVAQQVSGLPSFGLPVPQVLPGVDETQVGLDVIGAFDSNVARSDAALAKARGLVPEDFYIDPEVSAEISRVLGSQTLFLQGVAGYRAYDRDSVLSRSNIQLNVGDIGQISLCQTSTAGAYSRAQADLSELALTAPVAGTSRLITKDTVQDAVVAFSATCGHSIAPTMSVSETWVTNDAPGLQVVNARVFSGSGGVAYKNPVLGTLTLTGQYSDTKYPDRFVLTPTGLAAYGYQTIGGGISYVRNVGSRLQATLALNYIDLEPSTSITQGFKGVTYNVNVSYAVTPQLTASAVAGKGTTPSNEAEASYVISEIYGLDGRYQVGPRITSEVGVSRTHQSYEGLLAPVAFNITNETTDSVYGNGGYQLNRHLQLLVSVTYSHRDANFAPLSYSDVVVALTAKATF